MRAVPHVTELAQRYWSWVKGNQAPYLLGYSRLTVFVSLFAALASVLVPVCLLIGLIAGRGEGGLRVGVTLAFLLNFPVLAYAKHLGRREQGDDKWKPLV